MLQPKNYSQVIPRNYYNVAYRNTGVYKGMGQDPLNCPGQPGCWGYTPAVPVPQGTDAALAQVQAEIDALYGYTGAGQATTPTSTSWIQQYGVYLALGAVALILLMGGRR